MNALSVFYKCAGKPSKITSGVWRMPKRDIKPMCIDYRFARVLPAEVFRGPYHNKQANQDRVHEPSGENSSQSAHLGHKKHLIC